MRHGCVTLQVLLGLSESEIRGAKFSIPNLISHDSNVGNLTG